MRSIHLGSEVRGPPKGIAWEGTTGPPLQAVTHFLSKDSEPASRPRAAASCVIGVGGGANSPTSPRGRDRGEWRARVWMCVCVCLSPWYIWCVCVCVSVLGICEVCVCAPGVFGGGVCACACPSICSVCVLCILCGICGEVWCVAWIRGWDRVNGPSISRTLVYLGSVGGYLFPVVYVEGCVWCGV